MSSPELLKFGSESFSGFVDDDGNVRPFSDMVPAELDDALINYAQTRHRQSSLDQQSQQPVAEFRTPSDHKPMRRRAVSGPQYGDSMRIETPSGTEEHDLGLPLTQDEKGRVHKYTQDWKRIGDQAIKNGTHAVPEDDQ